MDSTRIEQVEGPLREDVEFLFGVCRKLTGKDAMESGGWYRFVHRSPSGFAWLRILVDRIPGYPLRTIHVVLPAEFSTQADRRLQDGRNWWGEASRDLLIREGDQISLAIAVEVLARSYVLDATS